MAGKMINVAVNNELEAIAHAIVSKDVVVYEDVVVSSGEQRGLHMQSGDSNIGGTASKVRDIDLALGSPIQGSPPQTTSNFLDSSSSKLVEPYALISNEVESFGAPPSLDNSHSCPRELVASPSLEALVTTQAKNEVQLVTSWFNLVESEQPKNLVRESTP
ncbi:hypothetical protein ACE6H2_015435 [Prunus campanulata]